ncbi:hypothetical protein BDC45DRAFT_567550 [Circinella umbellata]|nr:hypothetical protein BDC45DRAFT_567550 [Circinella umbellata]
MSSNTEYYQSPTRMWDSMYDDDPNAGQEDPFFLTNLFPDENVTFFCYNCDMQVGAYLREDYQRICDRCFGEFIEVQESNNPPASSSTTTSGTTVLRHASIRRSEIQSSIATSAARNNTTSLTVPPRQDTQRDREQQQQQNDLQEIQPGVSIRLRNNNRASNNNDITTNYDNNEDWWDTTPSLSIIPTPSPSPPITTDDSNGRRGRRRWWQKVFSKRSSPSSTTHPTITTTNHDGGTSTVNGRLSQFTSSLVRLKRNRNARSTTSFVSYNTTNNQDFVQASSSSAIETSRPHVWQDDEDEACAICSDELYSKTSPAVKLVCNHIFHKSCIAHWLERDTTCPYCRNISYMSDAEPVTRPSR